GHRGGTRAGGEGGTPGTTGWGLGRVGESGQGRRPNQQRLRRRPSSMTRSHPFGSLFVKFIVRDERKVLEIHPSHAAKTAKIIQWERLWNRVRGYSIRRNSLMRRYTGSLNSIC